MNNIIEKIKEDSVSLVGTFLAMLFLLTSVYFNYLYLVNFEVIGIDYTLLTLLSLFNVFSLFSVYSTYKRLTGDYTVVMELKEIIKGG